MPGTHLGEQAGSQLSCRCTAIPLVVERDLKRQSHKHVIKDFKKCTEIF